MSTPLDRIRELLPVLESPNFEPCTWPSVEEILPDGTRVLNMPYAVYAPAIVEVMGQMLSAAGDIDPYGSLPEDPPDFVPREANFSATSFDSASLNQVRRYLRLISRRERFTEGYVAGECKSGALVAALRRLLALS